MFKLQILGTGIYLPDYRKSSVDLDKRHGFRPGTIEQRTGVKIRHYADGESASQMAAKALHQALNASGRSANDIDCLIAASGTMEQAIPCNAARILAAWAPQQQISAFDINATCLSGLVALDMAASLLETGRYQCIAIVASDVASVGLDWSKPESGGLFGDGAASLILKRGEERGCRILASSFKTYSEGLEQCQIRGGGSLHPPSLVKGDYAPYGRFEMSGKALYRAVASVISPFCVDLFSRANLEYGDIDWLVPHQASQLGISHIVKKLAIPEHKVVNLLAERGNQIAVSLLAGLHHLLVDTTAKSGDKVLLLGTSAGLSIGGVIVEL